MCDNNEIFFMPKYTADDKTQSQEIMRRLTRGQYNPQEQIDRLPLSVQRNFNLELEEQLKGWDYDSNTVIEESLKNASDTYSAIVAMGIVGHVGIQAFLNMMVVTAILPNTGISLPFISYGGSSLVMLMAEMGVLLGISRRAKLQK
jgi:hypothetical protein